MRSMVSERSAASLHARRAKEFVSAPATVAITGLRTFIGQRIAERLAARAPRLRVVWLDLRRP